MTWGTETCLFLAYQIKRFEWLLWIKFPTTRLLNSFGEYIQRQKEATHGRQECEPPCAPDLTPYPDRLLTCIRHTRARRNQFYHREKIHNRCLTEGPFQPAKWKKKELWGATSPNATWWGKESKYNLQQQPEACLKPMYL